MSHPWDEALDRRNDLVRAMIGNTVDSFDPDTGELDEVRSSAARYMVAKLPYAEPVFVSADMVDLVEQAADEFDYRQDVPMDEPFASTSFCVLEKPLVYESDRSRPIDFMAWTEIDGGDHPNAFVWSGWKRDEIGADWNGGFPRSRCGHPEHPTTNDAWDPKREDGRWVLRRIRCLWRLAGERIVVRSAEHPSRHAVRRTIRAKMEPSAVTVIRLRRVTHSTGEETGPANYSHRFLVRGHWRWQYHPSDGSHRQRWISTHVKGPADKPLVLKERSWVWSR